MRIVLGKGNVSVNINGRQFSGSAIRIEGGTIVVDGKPQEGKLVGNVSVVVHGDCRIVEAEGDVTVNGKVIGGVKSMSGDVNCGDVGGDVFTMSGSVTCQHIAGSVTTMSGNVREVLQ